MRPDVLSDCDDSLDLHTAPNSDSDPRSSRQEHFYSHGYDSPNNTSVILPYQDVTSNHQYPKEPCEPFIVAARMWLTSASL